MKRRRLILITVAATLAACSRDRPNKLIIGMDATYPPFEMLDDKGEVAGVSVDLGRELAKHLGREVEFRNIGFGGLQTALVSGSIDLIISSMTANEERRQSMNFSAPYVKTGIALLVSAKSDLKTADDLKTPGRKIVVRLGTTGADYARDFLKEASVVSLDSDSACVLEVVSGKVDAWIYDQVSVMRYHQQQPEATRVILKPLREEQWAVAMKKGNDELTKKVDEFFVKFRADGGFKRLAEKHLVKERQMMEVQGIPFVFDL